MKRFIGSLVIVVAALVSSCTPMDAAYAQYIPPPSGGGGGGTVTAVTGGSGLTGGTITTSGTLSVTNPYNPASVAINGGAINGTTIGATTRAAISGTSIIASLGFTTPVGLNANGVIAGGGGSSTSPGITFLSQTNAGMYLVGFGYGLSAQGVDTLDATSTLLSARVAFKPVSTLGIVGTTTNDNAQAGSIGEFPSPTNLTNVPLTSGIAANVSSIVLSAGDWDVWGTVYDQPSAGGSAFEAGLNTTSATLPGTCCVTAINAAITGGMITPVPEQRISVAASTTVYLITTFSMTAGSVTGNGYLFARRVR